MLNEFNPNNNQQNFEIILPEEDNLSYNAILSPNIIQPIMPSFQNKKPPQSIRSTALRSFELFGPIGSIYPNLLYNFNIIYYDEALTNVQENIENCAYFKSRLEGTFYGINNFNLFQYVCQKIKNNSKYYMLISSGSSAEKLYNYCASNDMRNIYVYYIYCFNKQKYIPLMISYPKLKNIFVNFNDLITNIFNNPVIHNQPIKSSNLIFISDYNQTFVKLHFEIIRKYSLYKLLKSNNGDKSKLKEIVNKKSEYYKNLAKELIFKDDEAMVKYFKEHTTTSENELRQVFNYIHNLDHYISNYTIESFYYKYMNKFLREGDLRSFKLLSNHISKIIYHLIEYKKTHFQLNNATLYRKLWMPKEEINIYYNSIGKVICYPSFSSTSLQSNGFNPSYLNNNSNLVTLQIQQNYSPSIINIMDLSNHKNEQEYLCLPFTFFKIANVQNNMGNYIIYLTALNSEKNIEDMFLEFMENETDNLDPEGLDILKTINNNTTLIINPDLKEIIHNFN